MNKKGFAISVVLYSMVILVIGIFYLLLGIVRNRYMIGDTFKEAVINSIGDVDYSDNEGPVCAFTSVPGGFNGRWSPLNATVTFVLECTDDTGFSDSSIDVSDINLSHSDVVKIETISQNSISNGFKYTIKVTGIDNGSASIDIKRGSVVDINGNSNSVVSSSLFVGTIMAPWSLTYDINDDISGISSMCRGYEFESTLWQIRKDGKLVLDSVLEPIYGGTYGYNKKWRYIDMLYDITEPGIYEVLAIAYDGDGNEITSASEIFEITELEDQLGKW